MRSLLLALWMVCSSLVWADSDGSRWYSFAQDKSLSLNVELFLSSDCPHCHKADAFFKEIEPQYPWLQVHRNIINKDKKALSYFHELQLLQNMDDFVVPSVFFCGSRWVGFASAETTGKDLLMALNYCKQQIEQQSNLSNTTITVLQRWANANLFDSSIIGNPSASYYILVVALMDAFNPCTIFSLSGFFAVLFLQNTQKKRVIIGFSYIATIALLHFIQRAFTDTYYTWLLWARIPAAMVGMMGLYAVYCYYIKRKISLQWMIVITLLLGFMIQLYQQTCVMNWSYIFEQWLFNKQWSVGLRSVYEFAYEFVYLLPLSFILILYVLFIKKERFARHSSRFQQVGLLLVAMLSLILIFYPVALSYLGFSLLLTTCICVIAWFVPLIRVC